MCSPSATVRHCSIPSGGFLPFAVRLCVPLFARVGGAQAGREVERRTTVAVFALELRGDAEILADEFLSVPA